ncbi:Cdc6/Cdc18 family protein [Natrarchaeobius oligotrophus]|uniref:AAA family ATPase n=1 Tax=Natrarchaeobius chitinivorans TaxID=1679083 RepID=A0A3N6MDQ2_NATCH|nr:Cdc6/Cdc18 family protein [Natrarchaeobius chitinivorans]RQG93701.1 AAA family ATPase [Natrarchaeobius chitinivorans]
MIVDSDVLNDERVPDRELVVHRRDDLESILEEYRLSARQDPTRNLFITGPTGVGKTMLARLSLQLIQEQTGARTAYVDCWTDYTRSEIIYAIGKDVLETPVHRDTMSVDDVLRQLRQLPGQYRHVVLDEADQIAETDVLRDLHTCPDIQLVLIAHTEEDLWATVPDHIRSRISAGPVLTLEKYDATQLADVLEERANRAFGRRVIGQKLLERIASAADGDARVAIAALREAGQNADGDDSARSIEPRHIQRAIPNAREAIHDRSVDRLNDDQTVLYEIICEKGVISPGELYDEYRDRVDEPRVERTLRSYMRKLEHYDVVESRGNGKAKRFQPGNVDFEADSAVGGH